MENFFNSTVAVLCGLFGLDLEVSVAKLSMGRLSFMNKDQFVSGIMQRVDL